MNIRCRYKKACEDDEFAMRKWYNDEDPRASMDYEDVTTN